MDELYFISFFHKDATKEMCKDGQKQNMSKADKLI